MLKELFSIFKGDAPLQEASQDFTAMLNLALEMVQESSVSYWQQVQTPEQRTALYAKDVRVNKLERIIRKSVVAQLTGPNPTDVPFGLLMMSLVKDIERLGDYAKNLADVPTFAREPFPDDALVKELREISRTVESIAGQAGTAFENSDAETARELTVEGRSLAKRCDELVRNIARSDYTAALAVQLTLGARFYKRFDAHMLNLLSGVIMPLHKLDYFDEKLLDRSFE